MEEKTTGEKLRTALYQATPHAYDTMSADTIAFANSFAEGYKRFLDVSKTEREAVMEAERMAIENGFTKFEHGKRYAPGDKFYVNNRGKAIYLGVMGKKPLHQGVSISVAHIDSPRIDLKQSPLYEDSALAMFKTHYYGGIKKYQWTTIPLAMHGVIVKKDGQKVELRLGENADEPVFCIPDLLPHLGRNQAAKPLGEAFSGEDLNVLVGSRPYEEETVSERVKLQILSLLNDTYGVDENDFLSSELCFVPAEKARDTGFDKSMILSYGHDDRVCAYPILMAAFAASRDRVPEHTLFTLLADKEETGSDGNTGMQSAAFQNLLWEIAEVQGENAYAMFENSRCLSADVNAAFDPTYAEVYEKKNASFLNRGVVVTKFTGARGKSSTNDASAEFVAEVRKLFDDAAVCWQMSELGKVDMGGGGTVAKYIANMNIETIDVGVPVLSMHAPYEVIAKADLYMAYKAFLTFFNRT